MKTFITALILLCSISFTTFAEVYKAPASVKEQRDSTTTHIYEIKGVQYPIFKSPRGRYYIYRTSKKTNKPYKYYIPKEIQKQIDENQKLLDKH